MKHKGEMLNVLHATDWDGTGQVQPILDFLGEDLISHETGSQPHWQTGEPQTVHTFTFSRDTRNTHAHGVGFRAGFVVNCETILAEEV